MRRIALDNRIDAVAAAVQIAALLERRYAQVAPAWRIVFLLKRPDPRHVLFSIRSALDALLDGEPPLKEGEHSRVRLLVAEIEAALGLPHDPRSAEAAELDRAERAWEAEQREIAAFACRQAVGP